MDSPQETVPEIHTYRWEATGHGVDVITDPVGDIDRDATEATAWDGAHGDGMIVALTRSPRGLWMIVGSDGHVGPSGWRRRFRYADDALTYLARRWGVVFREAEPEQRVGQRDRSGR